MKHWTLTKPKRDLKGSEAFDLSSFDGFRFDPRATAAARVVEVVDWAAG
jgi:hypothetical protein